jgi:hypothetical protein
MKSLILGDWEKGCKLTLKLDAYVRINNTMTLLDTAYHVSYLSFHLTLS